MASSPALPFGYDPARVLVGDIDGDGAADLVYVGGDQVTVWINRSGNGWSDPVTIDGTPRLADADLLRLIDLFGNGVPGLLFSATDTATPSGRPGSWYLEFTGGVKPYLLSEIDNHIGAITRLSYASSTSFRLQDDLSWRPRGRPRCRSRSRCWPAPRASTPSPAAGSPPATATTTATGTASTTSSAASGASTRPTPRRSTCWQPRRRLVRRDCRS